MRASDVIVILPPFVPAPTLRMARGWMHHSSNERSALTCRTVKRRSAGLRDSADRPTAAGRSAGLTLVLVDAEAAGAIRAFLAGNRLSQDGLDRRRQADGARGRASSRCHQRRRSPLVAR